VIGVAILRRTRPPERADSHGVAAGRARPGRPSRWPARHCESP